MFPYAHLGVLVVVCGLGLALAQPVPPPSGSDSRGRNMSCGAASSAQWDSCAGLASFPNGNIYRGEFHHGLREGFGFLIINARGVSDHDNILSDEPAIYAGEFRGGRLNGHGVWFTKSGTGYSGTFTGTSTMVSSCTARGKGSACLKFMRRVPLMKRTSEPQSPASM
jgi:hypothetical protein